MPYSPTRNASVWPPPLLLLLLPCLLLWRVVFLHEAFVPADLLRDITPWKTPGVVGTIPWNPLMWDSLAEFYPWRVFAADSLRHGWLPLWNPYQFCGTPFVANSQSAVFYPLNLLVFGLLPTPAAFGVGVLLHLTLTGVFFYCFLRSSAFALSRPAALLGAIMWQLSAWQTAWLALPTFLCVAAWLPLALWLTDRWVARTSVLRAAALGACLGMMLLGGHLQIALYGFLLVAAYAFFRVLPHLRADRRTLGRILGTGLVALILMVGLAAPQLLPTVELSRMSHRAGSPVTWTGYANYVKLALPAVNLVTLFLPGFFGNPTQGTFWGVGLNGGPGAYMEDACSVGVLGLLLALFGLFSTWRSHPSTRFFALTALVALLLALGTPLDALLFFGIPGFAQSGSPGRILVLWTFCAAILAACGANALLARPSGRLLTIAAGIFSLLFVLTLSGTAFWISQNAPSGTLSANMAHEGDLWRLPVAVLLGAVAAFALWKRGTVSDSVFQCALAALVAVELLAGNLGFNRTTRIKQIYPQTPAITFLEQHTGDYRVMPLNQHWDMYQPPRAILPPNAATVFSLRDTQGYDSLLTGQYMGWAGLLDGRSPAPQENGNMVFTYNTTSPQANLAAVRYVVSLGPLLTSNPSLHLAFQERETFIYENSAALPRVRFAEAHGEVTGKDIGPNRIEITFASPDSEGKVIVADQWYPGWAARIGPKTVAIQKGPAIFRTVGWTQQDTQAKDGKRTLKMQYAPTSIRLGVYVLCIALSGISALLMATALRRRRSRFGG